MPIVGVVENMSVHICSNCGHAEHIVGEGGAQKLCDDYNVPFLGSLPLDIRIREQADSGKPTVASDPDSKAADLYRAIARKVAVSVAKRGMAASCPGAVGGRLPASAVLDAIDISPRAGPALAQRAGVDP